MKKIFFVVMVALFTATTLHAQSSWVTHKGDDRVSLKFPAEPKEIIAGTFAVAPDSTISYVFTIIDFIKFGIDSATLAPMKTTPEFGSQLKTGMKQSLPDVEFDDFKIGSWKGFSSYTTAGRDSKNRKYDMFMFIIGTKLYSASTIRANGVDTKDRDYYFSTVELTH